MKRSLICLALLALGTVLLVALLLPAHHGGQHHLNRWRQQRDLVAVLGLSDLSLSSEARYTRHVSQADLFSAFQDFPAAFEHFPTGSMIPPRPVGYHGRIYVETDSQAHP